MLLPAGICMCPYNGPRQGPSLSIDLYGNCIYEYACMRPGNFTCSQNLLAFCTKWHHPIEKESSARTRSNVYVLLYALLLHISKARHIAKYLWTALAITMYVDTVLYAFMHAIGRYVHSTYHACTYLYMYIVLDTHEPLSPSLDSLLF